MRIKRRRQTPAWPFKKGSASRALRDAHLKAFEGGKPYADATLRYLKWQAAIEEFPYAAKVAEGLLREHAKRRNSSELVGLLKAELERRFSEKKPNEARAIIATFELRGLSEIASRALVELKQYRLAAEVAENRGDYETARLLYVQAGDRKAAEGMDRELRQNRNRQ